MSMYNFGPQHHNNYVAKQEWRFETFVAVYNGYASKYNRLPFQVGALEEEECMRRYHMSRAKTMEEFAEKTVRIYGERTGIETTRNSVKRRVDETLE